MTPEQKQRIERIRGWQEVSKSTQDVLRPTPSEFKQAVEHIDFLLSLVKSREGDPEDRICVACGKPSWDHACDRPPLSHKCMDATSMRSACVEKVKAMAESWAASINDPVG